MPPPPAGVPATLRPVPLSQERRSGGHAVEAAAQLEFVRIAYRDLGGATWMSTGVAVAFASVLAIDHDSLLLRIWLAAMLVITGLRLWLAWAFRRASPGAADCARWGSRYVIATTLTAAGWGASTWLFPTLNAGSALGTFHVLVLAGLTTGSARILLPMRSGGLTYLLAITIPLALRFFVNGDFTGAMLGTCVLIFIAYMVAATLRSHRILADALVQRFEREQLAAELTAENARRELREAELREARERAESASRAKGEFLATISHEIRTPMNGVLGMLRVVRDTPLTADQQGYVQTAADSAESLLLLLNDVLDFSKIEAGRLELEQAPFPPATVATAVTDLLHARARDKGLQLDLEIGENIPGVVLGDATRVRQILVNLIGNAIKFTDRGRVVLKVVCAERTASRAVMQFTVTDSGIGIDSAALARLFKPFTQADNSMGRRHGGTGLGLAISLRLAQAMGGTLQVQSALNQGSTFRLILPCDLPAAPHEAPVEEEPPFVAPTLHGRVLVVEDDIVNRQVIELFLRKMSVNPTFAPDGEAALAAVAGQPFDVVLMDCQLPGIDGLEATRRIRGQLGDNPVKIIALTANASTHVREACLEAGMDDFLSKPVRFELLAGVLQRHLPAASVYGEAPER
jgi:signal transduction histidine kinase/ActR/RegA family two-component response regulator